MSAIGSKATVVSRPAEIETSAPPKQPRPGRWGQTPHLGRVWIAGISACVGAACVGAAWAALLLPDWAAVASAATGTDDAPAAKKMSSGKTKTAGKAKSDSDEAEAGDVPSGYRRERVKEIVLWNEHNGKHHDSGTQTCNLILLLDGKPVWHRDDLEIPWESNKSANRVIEVSNVKADALRVEITAWNEKGGGLSEIEVLDKTGTNLAIGGKVTTSADRSPGEKLGGAALIDGNYYSASAESGYWLLPDGETGWAELQLMPQPIPPPPTLPPPTKMGKKTLSRTPMPAEIDVTCDEAFEMYINGVHALSGHGQRCFSREIAIANGDVITVKCEGASETKGGFCFVAKFANSGNHVATPFGWKSYTPANPATWFAPERAKGTTDCVKGTSSWAEKEMKQESGKKMPMTRIWGTGKTCYLVLVADTKVKHIKIPPRRKGAGS